MAKYNGGGRFPTNILFQFTQNVKDTKWAIRYDSFSNTFVFLEYPPWWHRHLQRSSFNCYRPPCSCSVSFCFRGLLPLGTALPKLLLFVTPVRRDWNEKEKLFEEEKRKSAVDLLEISYTDEENKSDGDKV